MVKAIVVTDNISFLKNLVKEINSCHLDMKIVGVATNGLELQRILGSVKIDIFFLDKGLGLTLSDSIWSQYQKFIVDLAYVEDSVLFDEIVLKRLKVLINLRDFTRKRLKVVRELEFIGYDFKYKGTHYLVDTILHMYLGQNSMTDNLKTDIYPLVSKKYNKTIYNIKTSIDNATEYMYCECDSAVVQEYFNFCEDTKPTVKQVIFAVMNKIY